MKRTISLWLGLLALACMPMLAQTPAAATAPSGPTGKVHGHVTNPTGAPMNAGTVSFVSGTDLASKSSEKATATVDANGDYTAEVPPGTYTVVFRSPGTPQDKVTDQFDNVKVVAGQTMVQDFDMSREAYVDKLTPDQKKQLEELKKHNSEAIKSNEIIKTLNADIKTTAQDFKDADEARATAVQALGASASKADLDAKATEIKTAKYTEVETMMKKDTAAKPDASILWVELGQAQLGLKQYDDAETSYKKVLEIEAASKKPNISVQGSANSGLGEIYARQGKIPEANAAYDAAAKVNPTAANVYLKNEAVIFFQAGNTDAQVAAADEAIKADPTQPLPYYLKGQGLIAKATVDPKTQRIVLPPECAEAYQKYLELDPKGPYSGDVKAILDQAGTKVSSSYKAPKK